MTKMIADNFEPDFFPAENKNFKFQTIFFLNWTEFQDWQPETRSSKVTLLSIGLWFNDVFVFQSNDYDSVCNQIKLNKIYN
jgi:hypothetical protein